MTSVLPRFSLIFAFGFMALGAALLAVFAPRAFAFFPALSGLILLGGCAASGLFAWRDLVRSRFVKAMAGVIVLLPLLAALSSLWAINSDFALERAGKMAMVLIPAVMLAAAFFLIPLDIVRRYGWLPAVCLIAALGLMAAELALDGPLYKMMRGLAHDEPLIHLAMFNRGVVALLLLAIPAVGFLIQSDASHRLKKSIGGILALALISVLVLTDSQSSQLATLVALAAAAAFTVITARWFYGVVVIVIGALLFAVPYLVQFLFANISSEDLGVIATGAAMNVRLEIWDAVARHALHSPVIGYGIEATKAVQDFEVSHQYLQTTDILHPHNFALQIWIEFGAVGVVLVTAGIAALLFAIRELHGFARPLAVAGLFAAMSVSATGYGLWQSWWLGLLVLLVAQFFLLGRLACAKRL